MKRRFYLFWALQLLAITTFSQKYEVKIDLQKISGDKVNVTVKLPSCKLDTATWCMPAIIPGTYAEYDFGRFISNFKAYSKTGKRLKVRKKNSNEFVIYHSKQLAEITYKVNDTWDSNPSKNYVFQPAGTNIEKNKNIVLNHHGFVGYLLGMQNFEYEIEIKKNANFYANTALKVNHITNEKDVEYAKNYVHLADSPTLYCKADTISFKCNNSTIHIGVYSSSGVVKADRIKTCITPLANALAEFFNVLPINDYYFIFYFSGSNDHKVWGSGASGALEHNYSSFYFLPEIQDSITLNAFVKDVSAHEFLHILTPLNIHSFEIENFDFLHPKMSQHLWMYEGVTEYFAQLVQLHSGLITEQEFVDYIHAKIEASEEFPSFSFTEMSKNVCIPPNNEYYDNVYQKGALLAFMLDIQLSDLSNNKFGLPELMNSLAKKYGPDKPFNDENLINEIVDLTHPKIRDYFTDYIIGEKKLPYQEYFNRIGWTYKDSLTDTVFNFGKFAFKSFGDKNSIKVINTYEDLNLFGLKNNDQIISIAGKKMSTLNWEAFDVITNPKKNEIVSLLVQRNGRQIQLSALPRKRTKTKKYVIKLQEKLNVQQAVLKQKLFGTRFSIK